MSTTSTKKIYVLFPSGTGHINPVLGLVQELCKQPNIECIFYGNEEHKELINRTGAKFRLYANRNYANMLKSMNSNKNASLINLLEAMIDGAYEILPQLINDYEQDKPDLILYDCVFLSARYLYIHLKRRGIDVKMVEFFPNFAINKSIMESVPEINLFPKDFNTALKIAHLFTNQIHLSWNFNLPIYNAIKFLFEKREYTQIVAVFPELQPRVEEFGDNFKFVGQCVAEDVRNDELDKDEELKSILLNFDSNKSKLILVSIGTVFNYNTFIFEEIIKAIREFDKSSNRQFSSSQFLVVTSLGDISFKTLKDKISTGELILPENVILRPKVPQLDILKRADLFITHCGMNSTTETIKYGVPIIGIPIQGDQPLVARRVCDELSAGIRLDMSNLKSDEIADAIDKVLSDEKYAKNMKDLSLASAKYNGIVEGTKIILDILAQ